jgi:ribonuclease G
VVAQRLRERIAERLRESGAEAVLAETHPSVASHLIGPGGANLRELEKNLGRSVYIRGAGDCGPEELRIRVLGTRQDVERQAFPVREGERLKILVEERHATNSKNGIARVEGYVIDVEGGGPRVGERVLVEVQRALRTFATAKLVEEPTEQSELAATGNRAARP